MPPSDTVAGTSAVTTTNIPSSTGGSSSIPSATGGTSTICQNAKVTCNYCGLTYVDPIGYQTCLSTYNCTVSNCPALATGGASSIGGTQATGGASTATYATGGSLATGGTTSINPATGGSPETGGATSINPATGGAPGTGGNAATGGASSTGGTSSAATTAVYATGGSTAPGWNFSTGGASSTTGGAMATGGTANSTGGNAATGGTTSITCPSDQILQTVTTYYILAYASPNAPPGSLSAGGYCVQYIYKTPTATCIGQQNGEFSDDFEVGACSTSIYSEKAVIETCTATTTQLKSVYSSATAFIYTGNSPIDCADFFF